MNNSLKHFPSAMTLLALMGSATLLRSKARSPTLFLFLPIMSATATLGLMAAASCVGLRRRASMDWLRKDCVSSNSWWNQPVLRPVRR